MALSKKDVQVTRSLQDTVRGNKNIKEVYFNENGDHYFKKHEIEVHAVNDNGESTKVEKVWSLPGAIRQPVKVKTVENRKPVFKDKMVNVEYEPVAVTLSREEILNAIPVGDKKTEAQKLEILRQAAEIAKGDDMHALLAKLNSTEEKEKEKGKK